MWHYKKTFTGSWSEISKYSKKTATVQKTCRKKIHLGERKFGPRLGQGNFFRRKFFLGTFFYHIWCTHTNRLIQRIVKQLVKITSGTVFQSKDLALCSSLQFERYQNGQLSKGFIIICTKVVYEEKRKLSTARTMTQNIVVFALRGNKKMTLTYWIGCRSQMQIL